MEIKLMSSIRHSFLIAAAALAGCTNDSDPVADKSFFSRIYDNNKFNASYEPLDVVQSTDGGYLILGTRRLEESNFKGIYVLKADATGAYVAEFELAPDLVNPVGPVLKAGGKLYFFAMTSIGLRSGRAHV